LAGQQDFFTQVAHPYTKKLFASLPTDVKRDRPLEIIRGSVPSLTQSFAGCRFANRCDFVQAKCEASEPPWQQLSSDH
ncbi:MAG TPA: ABC transporter ATP-binding protein, partial [Gammaproteobacteria bacterium]|nr:ABC transporter ATP-binding protein [Gammaproteobacteria bacterium]